MEDYLLSPTRQPFLYVKCENSNNTPSSETIFLQSYVLGMRNTKLSYEFFRSRMEKL